MAVDPSIVLNLQPTKPPDYFGAYGNALTLKNMIGQQQLQGLQLAQAQREADKQMRLSDLVRSSGGDMGKFMTGYMEIDPVGGYEMGMKQKRADAEIAKYGAEGRKLDLENTAKRLEISSQIFSTLGENPTPEQIMAGASYAAKMGILDLNTVPQDPAVLPQWYQRKRAEGIAAEKQWAEQRAIEQRDFEREYPTELGKLIYGQQKFRDRQKEFTDQSIGNDDGTNPDGTIRAPSVNLKSVPTPYDASIARLRYGDENKPFGRDARGNVVGNEAVQKYELTRAEKSAAKMQQFNNTKDDFENERKLRNDFKTEPIYKAHSEVRSAYGQIGKSLGLKSPAGDLAAATKIMKLLDPGSVVRESELAMAVAASGLEDRITNFAQNIISGNKLTPKQRQDFRKLADELFLVSEKEYDRVRSEYQQTARDYNLSPDRVGGRTKPKGDEATPDPSRPKPITPPKPEFNLEAMPDPGKFSGKEIESQDGTRYKSDGKKWIRQPKGGATGRF